MPDIFANLRKKGPSNISQDGLCEEDLMSTVLVPFRGIKKSLKSTQVSDSVTVLTKFYQILANPNPSLTLIILRGGGGGG